MNIKNLLAWLEKFVNLEVINDLLSRNVKRPNQHIKNYLTILCDCIFLWLVNYSLISYIIGEEVGSFSWWDKHKLSLILLLLFLALTLKYDFYRNRWRFFFKGYLLSAIAISAYVTVLFIPCFLLANSSLGLPWSFPIVLFTSINAYIVISRVLGNYFWHFVVERKQLFTRHSVVMLIDPSKDIIFKLELIAKKYPKSNISVCLSADPPNMMWLYKKIANMGVSTVAYRLFESLYSGWMSTNSTIVVDQESMLGFQDRLLDTIDTVVSYETLVLDNSYKSFRLRKISYHDLMGGQRKCNDKIGIKSLAVISDSSLIINEVVYQAIKASINKVVIISDNKEPLYEHGEDSSEGIEICYISRHIITSANNYFHQLLKLCKVDKLIIDNRLPSCAMDKVAACNRFFLEPKKVLDGLSKATDVIVIADYKQGDLVLPARLFDHYLRTLKSTRILSIKVDNIFLAKENFSGLIKNCIVYNDIYTSRDLSKEGGLRLVTCRDLVVEILDFDQYKRGYSSYAFKGKFFNPILVTKLALIQIKHPADDIDKIFENYKSENTDLGEAIIMEDSIKNVGRIGFYELKAVSEKKINWPELTESLSEDNIKVAGEGQLVRANLMKKALK